MTVILNGKPHRLGLPCTVAQLVKQVGLNQGRIAIELNKEILPRSAHLYTELADQDRIEIIHAIGGG